MYNPLVEVIMWHLSDVKAYKNDAGGIGFRSGHDISSGVAVQFGGKAVRLVFRLKNCSCNILTIY